MHAPSRNRRLGHLTTALALAAGLAALSAPVQALPIPGFVENRGQEDPRVAFAAQTAHGIVFVTHAREIVYVVPEPDDLAVPGDGVSGTTTKPPDRAPSAGHVRPTGSGADVRAARGRDVLSPAEGPGFDLRSRRLDRPAPHHRLALYETVLGAEPGEIRGLRRHPTAVQYFIGNDPAGWLVDVPVYARLDLGEVAPGIRMGLHLRDGGVEKVFTVAPGASLDALRLRIEGADGLATSASARLELLTGTGRLAFTRPKAWQVDDAGRRLPVSVGYDVAGETYGFVAEPYDPSRPLYIDPLMASTYLASHFDDAALDVAVDAFGAVYILLELNGADFPTVPGGFDPVFNTFSAAVAELDRGLTTLRAFTYLGGSSIDEPDRLALLPGGRVAVVGRTKSHDFPVTEGTLQPSWSGEWGTGELFVSVLSNHLRHLAAGTYLGGYYNEAPYALAAADNGDIVVGGRTDSRDFPTTPAAYQPSDPDPGWEHYDSFLTRLSPDLTTLVASTYFGGTENDSLKAIAFDPTGEIVVAGYTLSIDLPLTPGAFDTTARGPEEAFVSRFDANLTTVVASTYFGGINNEGIYSLAVDEDGTIWSAGMVFNGGIPVTAGAFSTVSQRGWAPFVAGFSPDLTTLHAATYLHSPDHGCGMAAGWPGLVAVDPIERSIVVAGTATTDGYPIPPEAFQPEHAPYPNSDNAGFVVRLTRDLASVEAATYLGHPGTRDDVATGRMLEDGSVVLVGETRSRFPTRPSSFQTEPMGGREGFAAILSRDLAADPPACNTGDADADGRITAFDAQRVWALALGFDRPEAFERCRADCNADGRITAGDAQGVHAAALGAGSCADALPAR